MKSVNLCDGTMGIIDAVKSEFQKTPVSIYRVLRVESANDTMQRAATLPVPKMLFSEFWHEHEVCFLFADTGLGKSLLAVQIADAITRGQSVLGFKTESQPQPVLYLDFELSEKQFQNRYSDNYQKNYRFSPLFYRSEFDRNKIVTENGEIEEALRSDIERAVVEYGVRVIIIDNLTWLRTQTETASDALPLMKYLKTLQRQYSLSILILGHTPKISETRPISVNDLSGSKMLMNFVDSAFAIGRSHKDGSARYLKQIKVRACEAIYHTQNVVAVKIVKDGNFTGFHVMGYGPESEHLRPLKEIEEEINLQKVVELKQANPAISNREIERMTGIGRNRVAKIVKSLDPVHSELLLDKDDEPF